MDLVNPRGAREDGRGGRSRRPGRHRARLGALARLIRRNSCRAGDHRYGPDLPIGGGILRSTCLDCGAVSLDLREASPGERRWRAAVRSTGNVFILRRRLPRR